MIAVPTITLIIIRRGRQRSGRAAAIATPLKARISSTSSDAAPPPIKHHNKPLKTPQFGADILHDPLWNKVLTE
jgi:hypothetical protein